MTPQPQYLGDATFRTISVAVRRLHQGTVGSVVGVSMDPTHADAFAPSTCTTVLGIPLRSHGERSPELSEGFCPECLVALHPPVVHGDGDRWVTAARCPGCLVLYVL